MKQMGSWGPGFERRMGALTANIADHNKAIGR